MAANDICAVHLGPNGLVNTTTNEAMIKFRDDAELRVASGRVLDARGQRAAYDRLSTKRFYAFRDSSANSPDIMADGDIKRRSRAFSITRDVMQGPTMWERSHAQELFGGARDSVPVFGKWTDAGVDQDRFIDEVDRLMKYQILKPSDLPDYDSDESMLELLGKVYDLGQNEAQGKRVDLGQKNRVIDAAPGIYLFSELLKRTSRLIEEEFTELWARRIFSVNNLNTWMPQWSFERIDDRAELPQYFDIERLPAGAPRGSSNRKAELRNLAFWYHAASWTKLELMRYAEAVANGAPNVKFDKRRIDTSIRMMNVKEDLLVFFGDDDVDIYGLYSDEAKTGIKRVASTVYGGPFGSVGPAADRDLLIGAVKNTFIETEQVLKPDTIMLSTRSWAHVVTELFGTDGSDPVGQRTVLEMAEPSLTKLGIKDILLVPEVGYSAQQKTRLKTHGLSDAAAQALAGGDGDGLQSMVVCNRAADMMEMIVAKERTMYPAQEERRDQIETRCLAGGGGLAVYQPEAVTILTDVGPNP